MNIGFGRWSILTSIFDGNNNNHIPIEYVFHLPDTRCSCKSHSCVCMSFLAPSIPLELSMFFMHQNASQSTTFTCTPCNERHWWLKTLLTAFHKLSYRKPLSDITLKSQHQQLWLLLCTYLFLFIFWFFDLSQKDMCFF